jgi:hypothetical protein
MVTKDIFSFVFFVTFVVKKFLQTFEFFDFNEKGTRWPVIS